MSNYVNNPWIEKKRGLLENTAVVRKTQSPNPKTGLFTETTEYLDRRPEKFLEAILTNQHKYTARRQREGMLIEGLDYERMAKSVAEGTIVRQLLPTQPMKNNDGKAYYLKYKNEEIDGETVTSLNIIGDDVQAKTEKLGNVSATINLGKQLKLADSIDDKSGLNELESILGACIINELDNRYIRRIIDLSIKCDPFDFSKVFETPKPSVPVFIGDRFGGIVLSIMQAGNEIARRTRRGAGNWLLCSPIIVSILQVSQHAVFAPALVGSFKGPNYSMLVGKLNGVIDVYCYLPDHDPKSNADKVIVGYKGNSGEVDGGLIYCPHTMITHTKKRKGKTGEMFLPFATKEASFELENAGDYYASFDVTDLSFA